MRRTDELIAKGVGLHRAGRLAEAEGLYRDVLALEPRHLAAINLLAAIHIQRGQWQEAADLLQRSLAIDRRQVEALIELGHAQFELGRFAEAQSSYDRALALDGERVEAWTGRAGVQHALGHYADALSSYERAIGIDPDRYEIHINRAVVLQALGRLDEALASFDRALALKPGLAQTHVNRAVLYHALRRYDEALTDFERALALDPRDANAWYNRANTLREMGRSVEAVASYDRAIALDPLHASACYNRGLTLQDQGRYEDAIQSFDRVLAISPAHSYVRGDRLFARMSIADWDGWDQEVAAIRELVSSGAPVSQPFPLLAVPMEPRLLRRCAERYVADKYPARGEWKGGGYAHERIRVGYFSADFHDHATAYLIAEMIEKHDRSRFEIIAFSFGPDRRDDAMRARLVRAFDQFYDVREKSDAAIAELARRLEIDIAVDLKGLTQNCRPGIFALRPAPVQVHYLGYPGTLGTSYHDYLIADAIVIPNASFEDYTERVVHLLHCYQANDRQRPIAETTPSRTEIGLPDGAFVFCCFNNAFKITPDVFAIWMRLLRRIEGSVLWLLEGNEALRRNLSAHAREHGVSEMRLIFSPRVNLPEHLARHRHADLFLDTFYYNAHTTASDALWAGLPVLTRMGESFAGRVAASLLDAIGLPELVTRTAEEYEAAALKLASDPESLRAIREKLSRNRLIEPLFDRRRRDRNDRQAAGVGAGAHNRGRGGDRFTRDIEAAYQEMWRRHRAGLPPEPFRVQVTE
jgi:predicted O-linked N-acetylglucosamine transferase (SPINDLY family)